jgi:hypothetical protein
MMVDILDEVEFLRSVLIAMQEGASDEKRMMMQAIENRISKKLAIVDDFENAEAPGVELWKEVA